MSSKPEARVTPGQAHQIPAYRVGGDRRRDGASLIWAHSWNWGNSTQDVKGRGQVKKSKAASTDGCVEGGPTRISDEAAVVAAE